ncbi:hypothetical protein N8806_02670 [Flavobacteriaceae bacterium]|nr:hypothetical protein [Flavobacteriaceae bacterium]
MIKKFFVLLFFCLTLSYAQSPEKFTYQSIIKNSSGYLLKSQEVGLKISVLFNSSNGIPVYSEEHSVESNNNGLVTLIIGDGVSSDVFADIDWGNGEYFLKVEVDPEGGVNYVMEQTSQLLSVPYALYAGNAKVNLSVIGQSYVTVSGSQITVNKIEASKDIDGLSNVSISGDYNDLVNTPTLFDGDYTNLTNTPTLFDGDYANLTNTPTLFDGDYANLTNTPQLNDAKIFVGDSNNKSLEVAVSGDVTLANDGTVTIADDAITTAKLANITDGSILIGGASDAPTVVAVTGDVTLANDGTVTIADDAITTAKLANITDGSILIGGASDAPTVVAVSGDVTITNAGVTAIGSGKVVNAMLADDAVGLDELANITEGAILTGDSSNNPLLLDANDTGKILIGTGTGLASVAVSGDFDLASNGTVTIADDAVTYEKVQNIATANRVLGSATADGIVAEVQVTTDMIANNAVNLTSKVSGVLPIAKGGTGASSVSSVRTAIGLLSGAFTTTSQATVHTTSDLGVNTNSIVVAGFRTNEGNEKMLSAVPNSDGTITFTISNLNAIGDIIHWIAINP